MKYYITWVIHVSQPIKGAHDLSSTNKWVLIQSINEQYLTYKMKYLTWLLMQWLELLILHQYQKLNTMGMEW
jgi:membrane protease subunit (stomatin/prohibitin family)